MSRLRLVEMLKSELLAKEESPGSERARPFKKMQLHNSVCKKSFLSL
jgi:hypothetical protein